MTPTKSRLKSKILWVILVLAVLFGLIWEYYPLPSAQARLDGLPEKGLGFFSKAIPLTEMERRVFRQARIMKRYYELGQFRFFLTVIDGTRNRHAIHDPLYCYSGAGWKTIQRAKMPVEGGSGQYVLLEKDKHRAEVMFWFSDGYRRYGSAMRYWWQTTLRRLTLGLSGQEPVLIVVQPLEPGETNWRKLMDLLLSSFEL